MNHTPAPWAIETDSEDPQTLNIRSESVPFVASVWGDGGPSFEQAANARLIAAAPDLLAALEMIREAASGHVPLVNSWVLSVARAAINKTGA